MNDIPSHCVPAVLELKDLSLGRMKDYRTQILKGCAGQTGMIQISTLIKVMDTMIYCVESCYGKGLK